MLSMTLEELERGAYFRIVWVAVGFLDSLLLVMETLAYSIILRPPPPCSSCTSECLVSVADSLYSYHTCT